ncbi:hypothetical protein Q9S78_11930 [Microbacterium sp. KSW-18]|uniref:Uncharacterized protein n=1 Tax=Microbacterium aquilitoris TaxID=3067307 RepID=A0ABU3GL02_9MICO|nr:hypothetical protein [Microbacterium sp. KSW-18]MDT3331378.1 hypothetical protein [Microbacterium sp. KSW-18]
MASPLDMLHDLRKRVSRLEMQRPSVQLGSHRPAALRHRQDTDSIAIIRYLQTSITKRDEDRDTEAILVWLTKKGRPAATGRP